MPPLPIIMPLFRRAPTALVPRRAQSLPSRASTLSRITAPTLTCSGRRTLHLEGIAQVPVIFGGLFVALWTWKCTMLVVFQNKIIYMPGLPPNARWERIEDYASQCRGISWREERTRAADGTDLALCVANMDIGRQQRRPPSGIGGEDGGRPEANVYLLYFQGPHIPYPRPARPVGFH